VASETAQALGSTTAKFRDATGELRAMTAQIQKELEATRAELKRNAVALPEETQATGAQMRRVVGDQIKALNELAALVSGSNRAVDVLPAVQRAAAKVGPDLRAVSSAPAARQSAPVPPPIAQAQNEPALDSPEKPAPEPKSNGDRANPLASLTSMSGNIAQMFDHETVAAAWDRYRRGERDAFTRQLYTLQGQQTFDEIRRKYQRDPEFRGAVDRYVGEFESILAKVSRDRRDAASEIGYLASESGKIYTMLAHASGRFGRG
jgi:hypothetical protein